MFVFTLVFVAIFSMVAGYLMYTQLGKKKNVTMPSLIGLPQEEAVARINDAGLTLARINLVKDPQYREGTVVAQNPEALTQAKIGRGVILQIAASVEKTTLPDLKGSELKDISFKLASERLPIGIQAYAYHSKVETNRIIATNPAGGSLVPRDTQVDLLISRGPRPVSYVMPDLIGKTESQVRQKFDQSSFTLSFTHEETEDPGNRDKVITQDPAPGRKLEAQAVINLTIGT
jgi:serine/threonine-protein kinase